MQPDSNHVDLKIDGEIAYLRLCNPQNFNGLTLADACALREALETVSQRAEVKAVVLSGSGEYFCTGGSMDLLEQLAAASVPERREMLQTVQAVIGALRTVPALVYAQLEGLAAGAGVDLLLACDQIVASETAKINFSFSKLHLIPDLGGLFLMAQHVGHSRALSIYTKSETLDVPMMEKLGLLSAAPVASFEGYDWKRSLRAPLSTSKEALVAAKSSLWALAAPQFARHLELVTESVCRLVDGAQHQSAVRRTRGMQRAVNAASNRATTPS